MPTSTVIGIIFFAIVFVVFIAFLFKSRKEAYHKAFEAIASDLGGTYSRGEWSFEGKISVSMESDCAEIELSQGDRVKGRIILLILRIPQSPYKGDFEVKKRGIISRAKVKSPMQTTGNTDFDSQVELNTASEGFVMDFAMSSEFQRAALYLINRGFTIVAKDGSITATKAYAETPDRSSTLLREDLQNLVSLAGSAKIL